MSELTKVLIELKSTHPYVFFNVRAGEVRCYKCGGDERLENLATPDQHAKQVLKFVDKHGGPYEAPCED